MLGVLVAQLAQLADLTRAQVRVFLLPDVERGLADAHRTTDIRDRRTALGCLRAICSSEYLERFIVLVSVGAWRGAVEDLRSHSEAPAAFRASLLQPRR